MRKIVRATILSMIFFGSFTQTIAQSTAKGFIGLALADVPGSVGPVVEMVKPGGPADQAGVKPGDIVVAVNGTAVDRAATMTRLIGAMAPSQTALLSVIGRSGLSAQRLTIAVTIAAPNGASETGSNSAPHATPAPPTSSTRSPAPIPSAGTAKSTSAAVLSVSGYVRLMDPLEQAFTVEVPLGWNSVGALARQAALQINPYVRSLSPDKMTYLLLGDPTLPSFSPPSQMVTPSATRRGRSMMLD